MGKLRINYGWLNYGYNYDEKPRFFSSTPRYWLHVIMGCVHKNLGFFKKKPTIQNPKPMFFSYIYYDRIRKITITMNYGLKTVFWCVEVLKSELRVSKNHSIPL